MEALILAMIIAYAVKKAAGDAHDHWQGSKAANRKASAGKPVSWRARSAARHDTAYWAHQVRGGFPEIRHGLFMGWHSGRLAQLDGAEARAAAKSEHVQARARVAKAVREQRRRQEEALEEIRSGAVLIVSGRQPGPPPAEPVTPEPRQPAPVPPPRQADGPPPPGGKASTTPTEGTDMSDVTYDGVIRAMDSAVMAAEDRGATARTAHTQAANIADQMQAVEVDPATLGAMADHLDALDAAAKAQQQVLDTARNVHETLQRGHAQLAEAHKDAVVEAADKAFYQD